MYDGKWHSMGPNIGGKRTVCLLPGLAAVALEHGLVGELHRRVGHIPVGQTASFRSLHCKWSAAAVQLSTNTRMTLSQRHHATKTASWKASKLNIGLCKWCCSVDATTPFCHPFWFHHGQLCFLFKLDMMIGLGCGQRCQEVQLLKFRGLPSRLGQGELIQKVAAVVVHCLQDIRGNCQQLCTGAYILYPYTLA